MKRIVYAFSLSCAVLLAACQDDTKDMVNSVGSDEEPPATTLKAPGLKTRGLPQSHLISLAATVEDEQTTGTIHYAAFKESVHPGKPTSQELMASPYRDELPLDGNKERGFTVSASSKTKYFVYAVVQVGDQISEVAELQVETI